MKMINTYFIYFVLLVGCNSFDRDSASLAPISFEPPPSSLSSFPSPNFIPNFGNLPQIQINKIPHPFDMGGYLPCAVWINGKRADLTPHEAQGLAKILNLRLYPSIDSKKLHEGVGWQQPLISVK
jgi:hypothetical protein